MTLACAPWEWLAWAGGAIALAFVGSAVLAGAVAGVRRNRRGKGV